MGMAAVGNGATGLRQSSLRACAVVMGAVLLLAACAPASTPSQATGQAPGGAPAVVAGPKTLRIAMLFEAQPTEGLIMMGAGSMGDAEFLAALHAGLTVEDERGTILPRIAQQVPTVENGDWKTFPDGRMEVTWRLHPNVKWHDGFTMTADDYVFGMRVYLDNEIPAARNRGMQSIAELSAPDPHTLVVSYKSTYFLANNARMDNLVSLPRHLLSELYERGDKQALVNSPYWTYEFVGLGPYQLERWDPGTYMELSAFDAYVLGRPKIDRITYLFRGDANAVLATIAAGEADMAGMGAFKASYLPALRSQWVEPGRGTVVTSFGGTRNLHFQFTDPTRPWSADARVRQAMTHMLDRQGFVEALMEGVTQVAHTLPSPNDPVYQNLERKGLPIYAYDLRRAEQLMGEADWTRGADGVYRFRSGETFTIELRTAAGRADNIRETEANAAQFREAGLNVTTYHIPDEANNKAEQRTTFNGLLNGPVANSPESLQRYVSSVLAAPANRYSGANKTHYVNPAMDQLYGRYVATLDQAGQRDLLADMLKLEADQALNIYIYYDMSTAIAAVPARMRGPGPIPPTQEAQTWNIHAWELD